MLQRLFGKRTKSQQENQGQELKEMPTQNIEMIKERFVRVAIKHADLFLKKAQKPTEGVDSSFAKNISDQKEDPTKNLACIVKNYHDMLDHIFYSKKTQEVLSDETIQKIYNDLNKFLDPKASTVKIAAETVSHRRILHAYSKLEQINQELLTVTQTWNLTPVKGV